VETILQIVQAVIDGLSIGSTYALLALGLSLVFSVMGLINFAYGSLIVWAGYSIAVASDLGVPYPLAIVAMIAVTVALSFLMARVAFRPFQGAPPATLLLTSFGVALALQAVAILVFGDAPRAVPSPSVLGTSVFVGGLRISVLQIVALSLGVAVFVLLNLLLNRTTFGLQIRAAAEDGETAKLMGVRSRNVTTYVFIISGLVAAAVAFIWFARVGTVDPRADLTPTLKAFIAVVLGGLGSIRGAVLGGLALGLLEALLATFLGTGLLQFQQALAFVLLIVILLMRPQGIAGRVFEVTK
jgi:branched-chain amino acid transport system permease protein